MNQLHCANCVDFMETMNAESVDLTVTSPPYDDLRDYNGYAFDFESIARQLCRVTKEGGVVVWVVADRTKEGDESGTSFRQALYFKEIGFKLFDTMIYAKTSTRPTGFKGYSQNFEYMFIFSKGTPKTINLIKDKINKSFGRTERVKHRLPNGKLIKREYKSREKHQKRTNIWEYLTGSTHTSKDKFAYVHPAIFPEKLAEDHILSWSNAGDLVFDPMCGSGTVGKMALKHNRRFIGIDCSEEYIEIARQRLK